jgi:hypothetical protein
MSPEDAKKLKGKGLKRMASLKAPQGKPRPQDGGNNQFAGSVAVGDLITGKDAYTGQAISGEVRKKGNSGVTVKTGNGILHHIRWGGVKSVDRMVNPQDAMRQLVARGAIKGGFRDGTDGLQPENCDTIGGLLEAAGEARGDLNAMSDEYMQKFKELKPVLIKRPVLKGIPRIKEKLRADEKVDGAKLGSAGKYYDKTTDTYHCRTIRDTDGHTFTLNSLADVSRVLAAFDQDKRAIRIKNNFAPPNNLGYSDINMNVRLPNGTIAEIQINTTANLVAKERYGHSLFEIWRTIDGLPAREKEKYAALAEIMVKAQKSLYGKSNRDSRDGTYRVSDTVKAEMENGNTLAIFNEEHKEYADIVRPFVKKAIPLFKKAAKAGVFPGKDDGAESDVVKHFRALVERLKKG